VKDFPPTATELRLLTLDSDEARVAKIVADLFRFGWGQLAGNILENVELSPELFRLIADEWERKRTNSDIRHGIAIVRAWLVGSYKHGAKDALAAMRSDAPRPTMFEVRLEYALALGFSPNEKEKKHLRRWVNALEKNRKIPSLWTFQITLARWRLKLRKDQRGQPPKI
jgi:hypothetical protein